MEASGQQRLKPSGSQGFFFELLFPPKVQAVDEDHMGQENLAPLRGSQGFRFRGLGFRVWGSGFRV